MGVGPGISYAMGVVNVLKFNVLTHSLNIEYDRWVRFIYNK